MFWLSRKGKKKHIKRWISPGDKWALVYQSGFEKGFDTAMSISGELKQHVLDRIKESAVDEVLGRLNGNKLQK